MSRRQSAEAVPSFLPRSRRLPPRQWPPTVAHSKNGPEPLPNPGKDSDRAEIKTGWPARGPLDADPCPQDTMDGGSKKKKFKKSRAAGGRKSSLDSTAGGNLICGEGRAVKVASFHHRAHVSPGGREADLIDKTCAVRGGRTLVPFQNIGASRVVIGQRVGDWVISGAVALQQFLQVPGSNEHVGPGVEKMFDRKIRQGGGRRPLAGGGL